MSVDANLGADVFKKIAVGIWVLTGVFLLWVEFVMEPDSGVNLVPMPVSWMAILVAVAALTLGLLFYILGAFLDPKK